jgi:hypothetical protein
MSKKIQVKESQILSIIDDVIRESRKVIKVGNPQPPTPPIPAEGPMAAPNQMGQTGDFGESGLEGAPMDPNAQMGDGGANSQFDTNFDAGVEADEETDPKHYIQQLTGKLSQSLNSFNNEQGPDAGLSKYVASMIITAACKNLDDKAKKELIEKINSASSDDENLDDGDEQADGMEDVPMDDMNMGQGDEQNMNMQPVNERCYTKKALMELFGGVDSDDKRPIEVNKKKVPRETPKAWRGKEQINGSKK